jgi:hypothetical protein
MPQKGGDSITNRGKSARQCLCDVENMDCFSCEVCSSQEIARKLKDLGNGHFAAENFQKAVEAYSRAISFDRLNHIFYSNRSMAFIRLEKYQEALSDAHRVTLLQPSWLKGFHRMGTAYFQLGRFEDAAKCFSHALSLTSSQTSQQKEGSDSDLLLQRLAEVRQKLEQGIKLRWTREDVRGTTLHAGSFRASACAYQDCVYLFGGVSDASCTNDMFCGLMVFLVQLLFSHIQVVDGKTPSYLSVFDCKQRRWRRPSGEATQDPQTSLPPSFGNTCCMIGKRLYICNNLIQPMMFDVECDRWYLLRVQGHPARQRISHSTTVIGHKLYLFGGLSFGFNTSCSEIYNDFEVFDTQNRRWEASPPTRGTPPPPRHSHTASLCGHKLYIIGGTQQPDTKEPLSLFDVHCLDTRTWTWSEVRFSGQCPQGLVYHNALVICPPGQTVGTKILILGRRLQTPPNVLYLFDTILSTWYTLPVTGPNPFPRIGLVAAVVGTKIWLFGGVHVSQDPEKNGKADDGKTKSVLDISELMKIQDSFSFGDRWEDPMLPDELDAENELEAVEMSFDDLLLEEKQKLELEAALNNHRGPRALDTDSDTKHHSQVDPEVNQGKKNKRKKKKNKRARG